MSVLNPKENKSVLMIKCWSTQCRDLCNFTLQLS